MKLPLTSEEFREIYAKVPRLCVEVILKTDDGVVLSLRSIEPYKGQWHIPGGTVLRGESLVEAVKRVARDELGVEVAVVAQTGIIEYPSEREIGHFGHSVGVAFVVKQMRGDLRGSRQGSEVKTFVRCPENIIEEQKQFLIKHGLAEA